ncbi:MAG: hypothetical protein NVSMB1_02350 [Polyangiales bacterium]
MHVVAIADLTLSLEECANVLSPLLGLALYEVRLRLAGGMPAIVLTTADEQKAQSLAAALRDRGQAALVCDVSSVTPSRAMVPMKHFQLRDDGIVGGVHNECVLAYSEIFALFRAIHREHVDESLDTKETNFSPGRAVVTGGLMMTKTKTTAAQKTSDRLAQVLYVFPRRRLTPWLLRESETHYQGLGARLQPTTAANFLTTIALLRERSKPAIYDERLMKVRKMVELSPRGAAGGNLTTASSTVSSADLYAHLMARAIEG